jgi:hypothetical protein
MGQVSGHPSIARVSILLLLVSLLSLASFAQQAKVLAPHKPVPPQLLDSPSWHAPAVPRSMMGGLWMTDANFKSSIYLTNNVAVSALTVTPALYLSNGKRLNLPAVSLEPSGTAVISINDALRNQGIAPWATLIGYVELDYSWPWDALCATVDSVDVVHSTIFDFSLHSQRSAQNRHGAATTSAQSANIVNGMWWKEESSVSGFVALSNTSEDPVTSTVRLSDALGKILGEHSLTILPHHTKRLNLGELQRMGEGSSGGLQVTYDGPEGAMMVNGGLEDPSVGYSSHILFVASAEPKAASMRSYAAAGLMVGAADPMMLFPAGTVFRPYSVLRNVSSQPLSVTPVLWWMEGSAHSARLPQFRLGPGETRNLALQPQITATMGRNFNGSINLILEAEGDSQSLLMASGSVDQKNTYIFETRPHMIEETASRSLAYWSTGNGDDTMVTLWNPTDESQEFVFTLFFAGGHYRYPVHLGPRATQVFNVSEIIHNQIPDDEGNVIPATVHEGSARIAGSRGDNQHVLLVVDAGVYNVRKATCHVTCVTCDGSTSLQALANPFAVAVQGSYQMSFTSTWNTGTKYDLTRTSSWSSDHTNLATVGAGTGLVAGVAAGAVTITAQNSLEPMYLHECLEGASCNGDQLFGGSDPAPGTVTSAVLSQRTSGTVSSDDAAIINYKAAEGTTSLGAIIGTGALTGCFLGNEMVGAITPNTYSGTVTLHRWIQNDADYTNSTNTGGVTNEDDTSASAYRDDDPQSGGSAGKVYDVDAPGKNNLPVDGNTYRYRGNFYAYATLPDGTRISPYYNYYVRVSCKKTSSGYQFVNDVQGDNQVAAGTTLTSWNLK